YNSKIYRKVPSWRSIVTYKVRRSKHSVLYSWNIILIIIVKSSVLAAIFLTPWRHIIKLSFLSKTNITFLIKQPARCGYPLTAGSTLYRKMNRTNNWYWG